MNIDLSLTITAIIALVALISPIITCIISNHYELKKRKIEFLSNQKREALKIFSSCAIHYYGDLLTFQQMCNYQDALNNLYLYFFPIDKSLLNMLEKCRNEKNIDKYKQTLNNIVIKLSKQIDDK